LHQDWLAGCTLQEIAMAKAKKRVASRKEVSKRGKASAKPVRKKMAKRATPKKRSSSRSAAKVASRKAPMTPVVEDTIIDVIDEPMPGAVRVTEYETITTTNPKRGAGPKTEE
jgi:hypothetical protein